MIVPAGPIVATLLAGLMAIPAQDVPPDAPPPASDASRWYLERGTARREATPLDDIPSVVDRLAVLMRDGRVPGFYDGQFASTSSDFDALARLVRDDTIEHNLRTMAVMALQEAGDGEALAEVLEPLVISPDDEFRTEQGEWYDFGSTTAEPDIRRILKADLSRHARFALAKDGQPARVLEKIEVMKRRVLPRRIAVLDPTQRTQDDPLGVGWLRNVWFDIAYHFQQFDDYEQASHWFRQLCDHLEGDDTRWAHYNLGCMAALTGHPDAAMLELENAVEAGFLDVIWLQEDGDLASLRGRTDFQQLVLRLGGEPNSDTPASRP